MHYDLGVSPEILADHYGIPLSRVTKTLKERLISMPKWGSYHEQRDLEFL